MRIRNYRHADLQTLCRIDQACFPPGIAYSRSEISRFIALQGSRTWVAEADDHIIGFLIARRERSGIAHIVTIDVVAAWRRRGTGRALMDTAENWARERQVQALYLETGEDNLVAQRFYQARGYFKVERIDQYYSDGTAAWVMAKTIENDEQSPAGEER